MATEFKTGRLAKWEEPGGLMGGIIYEVTDDMLKVHAFDGRTVRVPKSSAAQVPYQRGAKPSHAACQKLKDEIRRSREMRQSADAAAESDECARLAARVAELEAALETASRLKAKHERIIAVYKEVILNKTIDPTDLSDSVSKLIDLVEAVVK